MKPEGLELTELRKRTECLSYRSELEPLEALRHVPFRDYCRQHIPQGALSKEDENTLTKFIDELAILVDAMERTGRVSMEAADLIDQHATEDQKARYEKLFGEWPDY